MQAAIAKLAGKLQQHPEDAEGWALLGPPMTAGTAPQSCPVPGAEGSSECGDEPQSTARITVKVTLNPKFKDRCG